jgi:hypothetical protein
MFMWKEEHQVGAEIFYSSLNILTINTCLITGEVPNDKLGTRFQASDSKIEFASAIHAPVSSRSWLVKVHAILGVIAWIFLGSIGILIARYYKPLWPNHVLHSYRVWFSVSLNFQLWSLRFS